MREMSQTELRRTQTQILIKVGQFCAEHGYRYYLAFGTLLGAVRHGGYIPWDDDIDVVMPRRDYEKFCSMLSRTAIGGLSLHSAHDDAEYYLPYAKVADRRTLSVQQIKSRVRYGVNIDIFPLDSWPRGRIARLILRLEMRVLHKIVGLKILPNVAGGSVRRRLLSLIAGPIAVLVPISSVVRTMSRVASRSSSRDSSHVGVLVGPYRERVEAAAYGEPSSVTFEGATFPAPTSAHSVLEATYGNYMTLPPENERQTHHNFRGYWLE